MVVDKRLISKIVSRYCFLTLILFLAGCATVGLKPQDQQTYWWRVNFKLAWPEDQAPDFSYHLLIADQILRPVITEYENEIELWRFHRRAAPDAAGHRFSFLYYSTVEISERVNSEIKSHNLLSNLDQGYFIQAVYFTDGKADQMTLIEATSDLSWPLEIQRTWPHFIMGVSRTWLALIAEFRQQHSNTGQAAEVDLHEYYHQLNKKFSAQWTSFGRHAYMHHLNALFGYVPVFMHETGTFQKF